jgi:hypothetical protein
MNPRRIKRVNPPHEPKKLTPRRLLPPIDRPETPRDSRSTSSAHGDRVADLRLSGFLDLRDPGSQVSPLQQVFELLSAAQTPDDAAIAIAQFAEVTEAVAQSGLIAAADLEEYRKIYPILVTLMTSAAAGVLVLIVKGLRSFLRVISLSKSLQPKLPPDRPSRNSRNAKGSAARRLLPLTPLKDEPEAESPTEHFSQFMAKILYKLSSATENDEYLGDPETVSELISLADEPHKLSTRTYAVAALKNEAHSPTFRATLVSAAGFEKIVGMLATPLQKADLFVQITGLIRNLIADVPALDAFVAQAVHMHLFSALEAFPGNPELVLNCFRILTKISGRQAVRSELLRRYGSDGILAKFLLLMDAHKANVQILSRVGYVFTDFAAYEEVILISGAKVTEPFGIKLIPELLSCEGAKSDRSVAPMLVQVIANLSVDPHCSALLSQCDALSKAMKGRTFDASDRLGLNLLCTASNLTFHDKGWAPSELIEAIPIAFVSRHVPSIVAALRTLCNLAVAPIPLLLHSKIPEMLNILLRHSHSDIVLCTLQALANLVPYLDVKRRFRAGRGMEAVFELLSGEEVEEMEMEAIAALVINFRTISADEARRFQEVLEEYELDPSDQVIGAFISFLNERTRSRSKASDVGPV